MASDSLRKIYITERNASPREWLVIDRIQHQMIVLPRSQETASLCFLRARHIQMTVWANRKLLGIAAVLGLELAFPCNATACRYLHVCVCNCFCDLCTCAQAFEIPVGNVEQVAENCLLVLKQTLDHNIPSRDALCNPCKFSAFEKGDREIELSCCSGGIGIGLPK